MTSDSSEDYDRGGKLSQYQTIPSVTAVVIISHRESRVEVWSRAGSDWARTEARRGQQAAIMPLSANIDVDALYAAGQEPDG